ncbi:ras-related protein Rab-1A-like [Uloborus diversus]|uniref:ras-related protein Rab-1A-like n=1 Tax=Uloborus diversus TaxID=327109 RepID=UPI00240982C4|nr:ras-related protein Rab-1A-like [Uloborus diversus]
MNIEGKEVKLDLWDTAGQDRYRTLTKSYYRMADGVILVYDVGNIVSFSKLTSWLQELRGMNENAAIVIVGNKTDNLNRRAVTLQAVESYAKEEKLPFIETSAKNGNNVNTIFESLIREILFRKGIISSSSPLFNTQEISAESSKTIDCDHQEATETAKTGAATSLPPIVNLPNNTIKLTVKKDGTKKKNCC